MIYMSKHCDNIVLVTNLGDDVFVYSDYEQGFISIEQWEDFRSHYEYIGEL